jgi:prepilin-type processing-associated H-X9-DG protein
MSRIAKAQAHCRAGYTAVDVLVVLLLIGIVFFFLLMAMPRGREAARLAGCQKNLAQIGLALGLYDQTQGCLPTIGEPATIEPRATSGSSGPLRILLETFGQTDFATLAPGQSLPQAAGPTPGEIPVPGFICKSDPNAASGLFHAPVSYRGTTGDDPRGTNGAFAPGRRISLADVEKRDGTSFTAAFCERLVGDNVSSKIAPWNYAVVDGPLPPQGCTLASLEASRARWNGDAGSSWWLADYRSTLYNHALPPNAAISCVPARGEAVFMGASSGHVKRVNLLMLDGSVKLVVPTIDPKVWNEFAAVSSGD